MVKIAEIKSVRDRTMQLLFLYVNMRLSQIKTIFSSLRLQPWMGAAIRFQACPSPGAPANRRSQVSIATAG